MMTLIGPAMNAMKGASDVNKVVYDLASTLEQARAYAIGNRTYVWVGIGEFDASKSASAKPQVPGVGRLAVAVVASKDGTRGYEYTSANLATPPWPTTDGAHLMPVSKVQLFENVHLAPSFSSIPNSGKTARPTVSEGTYQLGNTATDASVTQFSWPLGQKLGAASAQFTFRKVIYFDPKGAARIQYQGNNDGLYRYIDIGLLPTRGNTLLAGGAAANVAAIQINAITGKTRIYRP